MGTTLGRQLAILKWKYAVFLRKWNAVNGLLEHIQFIGFLFVKLMRLLSPSALNYNPRKYFFRFIISVFLTFMWIFYYSIFSFVLALIILPLVLLIAPFYRLRLLRLCSRPIGHFALNTELMVLYLKNEHESSGNWVNVFYTEVSIRHIRICNMQLYKMWKRIIPILPHIFARTWFYLDLFLGIIYGKDYHIDGKKFIFEADHRGYVDVHFLLKKYPSSLQFTQDETDYGLKQLDILGIPRDAKFVCLVVRSPDYGMHYYKDSAFITPRDTTLELYKKTCIYLAEQGYYVLRMGKYHRTPLNIDHPRVIDYAMSLHRSDFLDIFLCANCYFMHSSELGLDALAPLFRRPLLTTNLATIINIPNPDPSLKLFIPKKFFHKPSAQYLTYDRVFKLFIEATRLNPREWWTAYFLKKGIEIHDNSEEEILEATKEMLAILLGKQSRTQEEQDLQDMFWQGFPKYWEVDTCNTTGIQSPLKHREQVPLAKFFLNEQAHSLRKAPVGLKSDTI